MSEMDHAAERRQLIAQIAAEAARLGLSPDHAGLAPRVLAAMDRVPRHLFLPPESRARAYADMALPGDCGKTVSQPLIVALMSDLLALRGDERVLEIGTGMGYQTAILAELAGRIYSIERIPALSAAAARRLAGLGYRNIELRAGDGHAGWPEQAPFDRILCSAAPERLPPALGEQLAPGGRLVLPMGPPLAQQLVLGEKRSDGALALRALLPVVFLPMEAGEG